jgi:hypothetical protein
MDSAKTDCTAFPAIEKAVTAAEFFKNDLLEIAM